MSANGGKGRAPGQRAITVEQHDFEFGLRAFQHRGGDVPGFRGDGIAQCGAMHAREFKGLGRGIGVPDLCNEVRATARFLGQRGEEHKIDFAAFGMQIEHGLAPAWSFSQHRPRW